MTYFTKNFSAEVILPDGTVARSPRDIDRYLKANHLAASSDYSEQYLQNIRRNNETAWRRSLRAELLQLYKKGIWNDERNTRK